MGLLTRLLMQAERQAIERRKAAAAAAALEVTAAETAARAVKEREEVVALLEKEKEELQVEAAEALEKHAKEVSVACFVYEFYLIFPACYQVFSASFPFVTPI
jgi:hypothetical protein